MTDLQRWGKMLAFWRERDRAAHADALARGSGLLPDDLGVTVRLVDTYLPYAREHQPHLLRSRAKRQRKKAIRVLGRTMPAEHRRHAFMAAALAKAEQLAGP